MQGQSSNSEDHVDALRDSADRLERALDIQDQIISDIDSKAEHVTRLLGIVLGLVFSVLSVIAQTGLVEARTPHWTTKSAFAAGIALLLLSMTAAIITYLSSKYKIGLSPAVGDLFSSPQFTTTEREHLQLVNGAYGHNIRVNHEVIEVNSHRFRWTLFLLLVGIVYLSVAGTIYIARIGQDIALGLLGITTLISLLLAWYILRGKYLTVPIQNDEYERFRGE